MSDQTGSHVTVYVGTYTDDRTEGLHIFQLDTSSGELEAVSKVPDVHNPFFLAADAGARFLYAACAVEEFEGRPGGCIKAFSIDPGSGALTLLNEEHAGGDLPCYLSVDRSGRCLLSGNYGSGSLSTLPIDESGHLEPVSQVVLHEGSSVDAGRQEAPHVHSVVLSPDHRFAFAADLGTDKVMAYGLDASSGTIEPTAQGFVSTRAGAGPRHISFHPDGSRAYVINELDSTIAVFDYEAEAGSLAERQTLSALPDDYVGENFCADIRVHPSGRFLYGSNRGHDSIAVMSIDGATGELSPLGHEPSRGAWPWNLEFDPAGRYLLAANQRGNAVSCFRIDPDTGALEPVGSPVEVPGAVCVEIPSPADR